MDNDTNVNAELAGNCNKLPLIVKTYFSEIEKDDGNFKQLFLFTRTV